MGGKVPVVELFMGEGVVSLEVDGHCDVVGGSGGGDLAPEEQLVGICQLGQLDKAQFQLHPALSGVYLSGVSRTTPISSRAWPSSLME